MVGTPQLGELAGGKGQLLVDVGLFHGHLRPLDPHRVDARKRQMRARDDVRQEREVLSRMGKPVGMDARREHRVQAQGPHGFGGEAVEHEVATSFLQHLGAHQAFQPTHAFGARRHLHLLHARHQVVEPLHRALDVGRRHHDVDLDALALVFGLVLKLDEG